MTATGADRLDALIDGLAADAGRAGTFLIARHQRLRQRRIQVTNGKLEEVAVAETAGLGLQLFSKDGRSVFAALDRVDPEEAAGLLRCLVGAVRTASRRRHDANPAVWSLVDSSTTVLPAVKYPFEALPLKRLVRELVDLNREAAGGRKGFKVETSFTVRDEEWRIARSDGTRTRFRMPRATVGNHFTLAGDGFTGLTASAAASRPSYEILIDDGPRALLLGRARTAARRLLRLRQAPHLGAGSYPLIIDYALAKGLAHEAFGHAAESDSYGSSCLAEKGKLRRGLEVAIPALSIVDEPIFGDHAYQPVGANGAPRLRSAIVERGRLHQGLADLFTAASGGVPVTGAERAESYRSIPLPRMSNIRIEMEAPLPLPRPFDELEPEDVRELALAHGLLSGGPVAYLSGYRGGQVNTMRGDFVFNCGAIHLLKPDGIETYRGAIFSGHFLSAVGAVRVGFGPLHLDAIGTCGKFGQHVPSSGGSNALLFLERREDVKIGGRQ